MLTFGRCRDTNGEHMTATSPSIGLILDVVLSVFLPTTAVADLEMFMHKS